MNFIKRKNMLLDFYKINNRKKTSPFHKKICAEIPDAILLFITDSCNNYNIQLLNESIYELFEITNEEILNNNEHVFYERIFSEDRELVLQFLVDIEKKGTKSEFEFRVLLPKKGLCWLKVSSKKELRNDGSLFFYVRVSNITDIKKLELNYNNLEERFNFVLETSNVGFWDWDLRTNKILFSSQALKILEIKSQNRFNSKECWDSIVHPNDLDEYHSIIQEHFDAKSPSYENIHRILTSSGKYKWIINKGKVTEWDKNDNPIRIIGTYTDIFLQKEKELELTKKIKDIE